MSQVDSTQIRQCSVKDYQWLQKNHAFFAGLEWLTKRGYPDAAYQWVLDHGHSKECAEAEWQAVVRQAYFH